MNSRNTIIAGVVIALILVGGYLGRHQIKSMLGMTPQPAQVDQIQTPTPETPTSTDSATTPATQNMITITSTGFSPQTITIKAEDSVTWTNSDTSNHTVNSNPHPTHTLYPLLNTIGLMKPGEIKSVTFTTAGTYTYHDHLNSSLTGIVIVQ